MKTSQTYWTEESGWVAVSENGIQDKAQLVFLFGKGDLLKRQDLVREVRNHFPMAHLIGCSTAGEIVASKVLDRSLTATAAYFEDTRLALVSTRIHAMEDSFQAGQTLADALDPNGLVHVFVLSDGLIVNGSALTKGLRSRLPEDVAVTGGLAGDEARFMETFVLADQDPATNTLAAIGFYGDAIRIGYGSKGGWDSFGPDRMVTRSKENILYELDGRPALELYKTYLGEQAQGLPATALLFPLSLAVNGREDRVVRTILSVCEKDGSMTFAGDVPEGSYARLMKANLERLVYGAAGSAMDSQVTGVRSPDLAVLISCVGRKLVLKQRVDEEVERVRDILGDHTALTGFYSYGEICPLSPTDCQAELHNQTMTITTFTEE